jgi:hypothetical protein
VIPIGSAVPHDVRRWDIVVDHTLLKLEGKPLWRRRKAVLGVQE